MNIQERFLKYVSFTTTSDESSESCPSTPQQLELAKYLVNELESIGLEQVKMDENGYVYGLLPATEGRENDTPIGFISHMDTSPDFSGVNPKPQIIEDYDGEDVLLKGSGAILKVEDFPTLKWLKGRTLITTDGTTLLGADDKAGIAEIVTAMEELIKTDRHAESRGYENLWGTAISGSALRRTKKSAAGRICLTCPASGRTSPTRWTAAAWASWNTSASTPPPASYG